MIGVTILNRYKIESELGKGGMGTVYKARDSLLNRAVAIKFLHTTGVGTEGRSRLLQEARAVAQLNHPNIVSVYDAGEVDGNPFIVMELVKGETLRKVGKPTLADTLRMAGQICLALDHAHESGIIHRDLKLENIVIANSQTIKLMDFGLAHSSADAHQTQEGMITGTLAYLAPELIQGQPASVQSDLYAFGVILYELLTGHAPFEGNVSTVLAQHLHGVVTPPSEHDSGIPAWADDLVLRLLGKRPEERPASAGEVAAVIEQKLFITSTISFAAISSQPRNNLPAQLTSFIGRERELTEIKKLLGDTHMLTLMGPGGTGKTRLLLQTARDVYDAYPDGAWLVELAPILDPLLVPRTVAIAVGLRDEPQRPVIDMLCDYLREKDMLLLLDNCEHLVDACAKMAGQILRAAPKVRIMASSREALGVSGEVMVRVPSLELPDANRLSSMDALCECEAVKLFVDRATSSVPSFTLTDNDAPFLAQICHRLDGIPLAIELAAVKVRVLSVEQIAKRLDDRFRLLTGGSRTALERHQTLRATLDWSYNLLSPGEQILFRRLSVFVGGWTLEAAESI
ncbi:MAG: protein kinase, partial [Chloroflexi bacterium]|nr:protein kinase [Chloroflexota bacterium]